jgi:gliding motility-associated-like protein
MKQLSMQMEPDRVHILWIPSDAIDCDTCSNAMVKPEVNTTYYVTFTDVNGCQATDSVLVYVNFIEGIGVPQAFSPNGDGNNDVLFVRGFGIENLKFSVYNRYGQLVFETTDQNIGWDGMFKGREENPGVFVWVLEYTFINGNGGLTSGNTTLIR